MACGGRTLRVSDDCVCIVGGGGLRTVTCGSSDMSPSSSDGATSLVIGNVGPAASGGSARPVGCGLVCCLDNRNKGAICCRRCVCVDASMMVRNRGSSSGNRAMQNVCGMLSGLGVGVVGVICVSANVCWDKIVTLLVSMG